VSNSITKPSNRLLASGLQLCAVPLFAFLLGRQSVTFSGSRTDWIVLGANVVCLLAGIREVTKAFRTEP